MLLSIDDSQDLLQIDVLRSWRLRNRRLRNRELRELGQWWLALLLAEQIDRFFKIRQRSLLNRLGRRCRTLLWCVLDYLEEV